MWWFWGCIVPGTALSFAGATEHVGAWFLRACIVVWVILWIRNGSERELRLNLATRTYMVTGSIVLTAALINSHNAGVGLQPAITMVLCAVLFVAIQFPNRQALWPLLPPLSAVAVFFSAWSLYEAAVGASRGSAGFVNPNHLAAFLLPLCAIHTLCALGDKRHRLTHAMLATMLLFGIWSSGSRAGFLTIGFIAVTLIFGRSKTTLRLALPASLLALGAAAWGIGARFLKTDDPYSLSRLSIWQASADIVWKNPQGVGLGSLSHALQQRGVAVEGLVSYPKLATQAHSEWLQWWAETGWLGLALMAIVILWPLHAAYQRRRQNPQSASHIVALWASFAIPASFSTTLHVPIVAAMAAIGLGILARMTHQALVCATVSHRPKLLPALAFTMLCLAAPGSLGTWLMKQAQRAQREGELASAQSLAEYAQTLMPWSEGAALQATAIAYARGRDVKGTLTRLMQLAQSFDYSARPARRALNLVRAQQDSHSKASLNFQRELLEVIASRAPRDAVVRLELARTYKALGQRQQAISNSLRALSLEPHYANAHAFLAGNLANPTLASAHAQKAWDAHRLAPSTDGRHRAILSLDHVSLTMLREVDS